MARSSASIKEYSVCGVIPAQAVAASSGLPKAIGETEFCNSNDTVARGREGLATSAAGDKDVCNWDKTSGELNCVFPSLPRHREAWGSVCYCWVWPASTTLVIFIPYNQALTRHSSFHMLSQLWAKRTVGPHRS